MPSSELQIPFSGEGIQAPAAPNGAAMDPTFSPADIDSFIANFPHPPDDLISEDGEPLETNWHALQIGLLIDVIHWHRKGKRDFFAGGNMFVYYNREQTRSLDYRGPDFFLVNDVPAKSDRPYWAIWDEGGRYPDLIVELMSPKTKHIDLTTRFEIYEKIFATREYVAYDPATQEIKAWRKHEDGAFHLIDPDEHGHFFLKMAGLAVGTWFGTRFNCEATWLRFFDAEGGIIPTNAEAAESRANAAAAVANAAKSRAEAEKARADGLAAEVARLRAQLANPV